MKSNRGSFVADSVDNTSYHAHWDFKGSDSNQEIQSKRADAQDEPSGLFLSKQAMNVLLPFIYKKHASVGWGDDLRLRLIGQFLQLTQYWETRDGVKLLTALHETAEDLKFITKSAGYILYVVDDTRNELFICSKSLEELEGRRYSWNLDKAQTIAIYSARKLKHAVINDELSVDARYPDGQDLGEFTCSNILSVPVKKHNQCLAVIEFYRENGDPYVDKDVTVATYLLALAADVVLENRDQIVKSRNDEVNKFLLENISTFCSEHNENKDKDEHFYIKHIVNCANFILNSESVNYYTLVDDDHFVKTETNQKNPALGLSPNKSKLRTAKEIEIATIVKKSQSVVNFEDVFSDPRFDKAVDRKIGLLIRSVLGLNVCREKSHCFGVLMAINKQSEKRFTSLDEILFSLIVKYLTIGLEYIHALQQLENQKRIMKGLYEVFDFQLARRFTVPEVYSLQETLYLPNDFHHFSFVANDPECKETPKYLFFMINSLVGHLIPSKPKLYHFIFGAKKLYRETNPYHNFDNAFKAVHVEYLIFKHYPHLFTEIEQFAMLLAALMHDCDHRGLSVKFLQLTNHPIIDKLESTPMEMYHYELSQCVFKKTHILHKLNSEEHEIFDEIFKECVKASNILLYLKRREVLENLLTTGALNWEDEYHRTLIRSIIVIAGDFSSVAKLPADVLIITSALYSEFFAEADLLKELKLSRGTLPQREDRLSLPSREETFIKDVALPCYDLLKHLFPGTSAMYDNALKSLHMWARMAKEIQFSDGDESKINKDTLVYLNSIQ